MTFSSIQFTNDDPVRAWYYAAPSHMVRGERPLACNIAGEEIVLYRGASGNVHALAAHCAHMGANLSAGKVIGERLRCAMHHRMLGGGDACANGNGHSKKCNPMRQPSFPVAERFGAIFIFNAQEADFPPPEFANVAEAELKTLAGHSLDVNCPWQAIVSNGFDLEHFRTVHERRLREPPTLTRPAPHCLRLHYVSSVTGTSPADRAMKWLSRDRIDITITCWGGPLMLVESDLGRARSALVFSAQPLHGRAHLTPVFCVHRSSLPGWDMLRLRAARWLFQSFLRRDLAFLDGMRFEMRDIAEEDPVHFAALEFLQALPHCELCETRETSREAGYSL